MTIAPDPTEASFVMTLFGAPDGKIPDEGWKIFLVGMIFTTINLILLILRLVVRFDNHAFGLDDVAIIVSFVRLSFNCHRRASLR